MRSAIPGRLALLISLSYAALAQAGPADGTARRLAPPPRQQGGRAVYDAARTRVLLFGGGPSYSGEVFELPLTGPRVWRRLAVSGTPPAARAWFSMIVDPVRDRLIGFGGTTAGGTFVNDVWQLSLAGTPTWSALAPAGGGPSARQEHSAIYDPVRDRMVVFGGGTGFGFGDSADVWTLSLSDPPAWQRIVPSGSITARSGHTAIYDPDGDRMIVYGGRSGSSTVYGDLKALSLGASPAWSTLTPTAGSGPPQPRHGHAAVWDPTRKQMIISGGGNSLRLSDAWRLALSPAVAWTSLPGLPVSPAGHYSVYDPLLDGVIAGDGLDQFGYEDVDFELSLASPVSWTLQSYSPYGGVSPAFALDSVHGRALLFEGLGTWALSMEAEPQWTPLLLTGPKPPLRRATFHDPVRNRLIVIAETAVWSLDLASPTAWTTLATTGGPPSFSGQAAVYDPIRDRALVYDGTAAKGIWQLSLAGTPAWSPLSVGGSPPPDRSGPALAYEPAHDRLIAFGGTNANDVWEVPLAGTPAWSPIVTSGTPPAKLGNGACVLDALRHRLVVFGIGTAGLWSLPLEGEPIWTTLSPQGDLSFSGTGYQGAVFDAGHDRIITYGGGTPDLSQSFELAFSGVLDAPHPPPASARLAFSRIAPDPASGQQLFEWSRPAAAGAHLSILDVTGRRIWSRTLAAGDTRAVWSGKAANGRAVAPGVYFALLTTADGAARQRIVRLR